MHFTATDPANPILPPDYTFLPGDLGMRDFPGGVTLFSSGTQIVLVQDQNEIGGGLVVEVSSGSAQELVFTSPPSQETEGSIFGPVVEVTARDASNNVATGFTGNILVSIGNNPTGGTLGGTRTVAAVAGVATFADLSIDKYGSNYTLTAVTSGISTIVSSPFTITPAGMTAMWTGAASSDPTDGNNWVGGVPPGDQDNVFIPFPSPNYPVHVGNAVINDMVLEGGATFTMDPGTTFRVDGNLHAGNSVIGPDSVWLTGVGKTVSGHVPKLVITGSYTATDSVKVDTDLRIRGLGANLMLAGHRVKVGGKFFVEDTATITMTNPADTLDVALLTMFAGANTTGLLGAGRILARGDFDQVGYAHQESCSDASPSDTVETFMSTGTRVELIGTVQQTVTFGTPVSELETSGVAQECQPLYPLGVGSHFADLIIDNAAGVTFTSDVYAAGNLQVLNGNISASSRRISVGGALATPGDITAEKVELGNTVSVGGTWTVNTTTYVGNNQQIAISLPYVSLRIVGTGTATNAGPLTIAGDLVVGGSAALQLFGNVSVNTADIRGDALLILNGRTLQTANYFQVRENAKLVMTQSPDLLQIGGDGYFLTQANNDALTNGVIELAGRFIGNSCGCTTNFVASNSHKVILNGTGVSQQVGFDAPGQSHFQHLEIQNTDGMGLATTVTVNGDLTSTPGGDIIVWNGSPTLIVVGNLSAPSIALPEVRVGGVLDVSGTYNVPTTVFTGTGQTIPFRDYPLMVVTGSASLAFIESFNTSAVRVDAGASLDLAGNDLRVTGNVAVAGTMTAPAPGMLKMTGAGTTLKGSVPRLLVLDSVSLDSTVQVNGTVHIEQGRLTLNGYQLTATDSLITTSGGQLIMTNAADVLSATNVKIQGGSTLGLLTAGELRILGNFEEAGVAPDTNGYAPTGAHTTVFKGTGTQTVTFANVTSSDQGLVRSQFNNLRLENSADLTFFTVWTQGNAVIAGSANLAIGSAQGSTIVGDLETQGSGTLTMSGGEAQLKVAGDAVFNGGSTLGKLTGGTLWVDGHFTQSGNDESYAASASHNTRLSGAITWNITFEDPDSTKSHFGNLVIDAVITRFQTNAYALGNMTVDGTVTGSAQIIQTGLQKLVVGGDFGTSGSVLMNNLTALHVVGNVATDQNGINPDTLALGGNLNFSGTDYAPAVTRYLGIVSQVITNVPGNLNTVHITNGEPGVVHGLSPNVTLDGDVVVDGPTAVLNMNESNFVVGGGFETKNGGTMLMTSNETLTIVGSATFAGGDQTAGPFGISSGSIQIGGNFGQAGDPKAFVATGSNTVAFTGETTHTISFANPGATLSHFQNLDIDVGITGVVTLAADAHATGNVTVARGRLSVNAKRLMVDGTLSVGSFPSDPATLDFGAPDGQKSMIRVLGALDMGGQTFFSMHEANDSLVVSGDASFFGNQPADTALTGGVIVFGKGFDEDGSPGLNINPTGNNKVVAVGAGGGLGVTFWFASGAFRHFEVADTGKVRFGYSSTVVSGNLSITGSGELDGNFATIQGNATVSGSGVFDPNASTVEGNLSIFGTGVLRMQSGAGFTVNGDATFAGGSTADLLTEGVLEIRGDFMQTGSPAAFAPSGNHVTALTSTTGQSVSFENAGAGVGSSHFHNLTLTPISDVTLFAHIFVNGELMGSTNGTDTSRVLGGGFIMHVARTNVSALTLDRVLFKIEDPSGGLQSFNNVRFEGYNDEDIMFEVQHPGPGPLQFNGLNFESHTAGGGAYIMATDTDGGSPLTITDLNRDPGNGPSRTQTVNGASVTWLPLTFNVASATAPNATTVEVTFDRPPQAAAANTALNYAITGGVSVSNASLTGNVVTLTTSSMSPASYTVTVAGAVVRAIDGQTLTVNSAAFTVP